MQAVLEGTEVERGCNPRLVHSAFYHCPLSGVLTELSASYNSQVKQVVSESEIRRRLRLSQKKGRALSNQKTTLCGNIKTGLSLFMHIVYGFVLVAPKTDGNSFPFCPRNGTKYSRQ